jgi:hypothetical protein
MHHTSAHLRNPSRELRPLWVDPLYKASIELLSACRGVQIDLVGNVLADPAKHVAIAADAGVRLHRFDDDLMLIFGAAAIGMDIGAGVKWILALAHLALDAVDSLDSHQPADTRGVLWSPASLVSLAATYRPNRRAVGMLAHELVDLRNRIHDSRQQYRRLLGTLHGWKASAA